MQPRYLINSENAAWRIVDGEAVILSADTTYYYSLNKTGTLLWRLLLEQELSVDELAAGLAERFGQPSARVAKEVKALIELLHADRLILEDSGGESGATAGPVAELVAELVAAEGVEGGYERPSLEKFDTLEKLIVSGE